MANNLFQQLLRGNLSLFNLPQTAATFLTPLSQSRKGTAPFGFAQGLRGNAPADTPPADTPPSQPLWNPFSIFQAPKPTISFTAGSTTPPPPALGGAPQAEQLRTELGKQTAEQQSELQRMSNWQKPSATSGGGAGGTPTNYNEFMQMSYEERMKWFQSGLEWNPTTQQFELGHTPGNWTLDPNMQFSLPAKPAWQTTVLGGHGIKHGTVEEKFQTEKSYNAWLRRQKKRERNKPQEGEGARAEGGWGITTASSSMGTG